MCLLSFCDHGSYPDFAGLENACANNPDGFGWAIHLGDSFVSGRFMDADVALQTYEDALRQHPGFDSMFHARWATHGATDLANVHPFKVGGSPDTLLAHNGVISDARQPNDGRSDTRWFAEVELPRRGLQILDKPNKREKLERYIGSGSKVIVFTTLPSLRNEVYILNERHGHWEDGRWWSNDSYQYRWYPTSGGGGSYYYTSAWATDDDEAVLDGVVCTMCETYTVERDVHTFGYCMTCETCFDCGINFDACMCWSGSTHTRWSQEELDDMWDGIEVKVGKEW